MIEKKKKKKKKKKQKKKKKKKNHFFFFFFFFFFFLNAIKFTESAAFCRVGRVTGNNNKFLLGLSHNHVPQFFIINNTFFPLSLQVKRSQRHINMSLIAKRNLSESIAKGSHDQL